jgi:trans-2-enoyl-CoA reductase
MSSLAIRYHQYGKLQECLVAEEVSLPEIEPDQVHIKLLAASINPSDFGMIMGSYGQKKELPAVAGREGVGEIIEIGKNVNHLKPGQWVQFPESLGTWQEACVTDAEGLKVLPEGLPIEMAATLFINPPTAWRLLHDFVELKSGDWIIQNAANSAVGIFVIQLAKKLGIKTLNIVRRKELKEKLKELGADEVFSEEEEYWKTGPEITGGKGIKLALNSVGGESAINLIKGLSPGGTHVTFGAMSFEPIRFPTRQLIFGDIKLAGFWIDSWMRSHSQKEVDTQFENIYALIKEGTFSTIVEKWYSLSAFKEALEHAAQPRFGKILFRGEE